MTSDFDDFPIIVVGAGLYGLTCAQQLAEKLRVPVAIIEARNNLGGNAYSYIEENSGIEVHKYGSHLFHTNNEEVWRYVNRFTEFNRYIHTVKTVYKDKYYPMPINLTTISDFYGKNLTPNQARDLIKNETIGIYDKTNLEEKAISLVGKPLYDALIKGYTQKQWQTPPTDLPPEIITRLPVKYNFNDNYFDDRYQGLPLKGYSNWFDNMVADPLIKVFLGTDFFNVKEEFSSDKIIIYTGPIDRFFNFSEGRLGWRTLDFDLRIYDEEDFQGCSVINYADVSVPFTRVHEFKHLHPERNQLPKTAVMYEFSRFAEESDEPYYPISTILDREILHLYRKKIDLLPNYFFGGRLGRYQYLDMHMAISSALKMSEEIHEKFSGI